MGYDGGVGVNGRQGEDVVRLFVSPDLVAVEVAGDLCGMFGGIVGW